MINVLQLGVFTAEGLCFAYSLYQKNKLNQSDLKWLPWVLGFIFFSDLLGVGLTHTLFAANKIAFNLPYYNTTTSLIIHFLTVLFLRNLQGKVVRNLVVAGLISFWLLFLLNVIWLQPFLTRLHTYSFAYGSVVLCLAVIFYIRQLVRSERIVDLHSDPLFWIGVGIIPFYGLNIPYMAMYNYLALYMQDLLLILRNITNFLCYLMYGSIFIGLLCLKKKLSSESSQVVW